MINEARKGRVFYGWWIVLGGFLTQFLCLAGVFYTFSVFLKPLSEHFGWGRGEISVAHTIYQIIFGLGSGLVGGMCDRYGPKIMFFIGSLILGLFFLLLSLTHSLWYFYIIYFFIGFGMASAGPVPLGSIISRWFDKKKGLAMGFSMAGVGMGGFVLAPLSNLMIVTWSWSIAYMLLGISMLVMIPIYVMLIMKNDPAEKGLLPDGAGRIQAHPFPSDQPPHQAPTSHNMAPTLSIGLMGLSMGDAIKTFGFWILSVALFIQALGAGVALIHFVPIITDKGFSSGFASSTLGFVLLFSTLSRIGCGYMGDKYSPRKLLSGVFFLIAIGMLVLLKAKTKELLLLTPVFIGLGIGGIIVLLTLSVGEVFGMKAFGTILGVLHMILIVGVGIGPAIAGFIYDMTGGYTVVITLAIGLILTSALALLFVPPLTPQISD